MKSIHIKYFASLREQAKIDSEIFQTQAETYADLYQELNQHYGFSLKQESLQIAINHEFSNFNQTVKDQDQVVFIPPVAGG
jgi:sulfur-carrier protein